MLNRPPLSELDSFLEQWPAAHAGLERALVTLRAWAEDLPGAALSFVARHGISHSLRFDLYPRPAGRRRPVFFLVDVVASAGELFLSACFYEDEISDPEELGNAIPQGLFMETGYCFDVDDYDETQMTYLHARLLEAHAAAGVGREVWGGETLLGHQKGSPPHTSLPTKNRMAAFTSIRAQKLQESAKALSCSFFRRRSLGKNPFCAAKKVLPQAPSYSPPAQARTEAQSSPPFSPVRRLSRKRERRPSRLRWAMSAR